MGCALRLAMYGTRLWRRKPSRTRGAQGVRHHGHCQTGVVVAIVGVGSPEPGVTGVDVLLAMRGMHGWAAGPAVPGIDDGWAISTASEVAGGEP